MKRVITQRILAFSALIVCSVSSCAAQDADGQSPGYLSLDRRTPQQMSAGDTAVLKARAADVVRAAEFYGFDLGQGSWSYQQSICPLMPKHLIVNYVREESGGVVTQFAAVVPRGREPVRVVPVQRSGLAPFAPAETSSNSAALFNRVWSSEGGDIQTIESESNWITLGLCYAEIVGSHPLIVTAKPLVERNAGPPTLRFETDGGASALFTDIGMPAQTWGWTLGFDRHGNLRHAEREKVTRPVIHPAMARVGAAPLEGNQPAPTAPPESASAPPAVTVPRTNPVASATARPTAREVHTPQVLPDTEAPAGRIIPDAQEAPTGRIIPGPQELPPSSHK